jgi:hypothetical protein
MPKTKTKINCNYCNKFKICKCKYAIRIQKWWINKYILKYINVVKPLIIDIIIKNNKPFQYEKTVFGITNKDYINNLIKSHKIRQLQMKEGFIGEVLMGNFYNWTNLKQGHVSGLDIQKKDNSCIIELKNKYNTCNSSSLNSVLNKLALYKKKIPIVNAF